MPGPDPLAVWQDDDAEPGQIRISFERPWNGNHTARKARAIAILRNLQRADWRCRGCGDPVGRHKRADAVFLFRRMPETGGAAAAAISGEQMTRKHYHGPQMTGADLRAHRKAAGFSQAALAKRAGFARGAVGYWERKAVVPTRYGAPRRFCDVLGVRHFPPSNAHAGGWGLSLPDPWQARLDALAEVQMVAWLAREAQRAAKRRVLCGAKTRKGNPCLNLSEPGKRRCKFHGGKSTGPRIGEGRARIAAAQRLRWAKWREKRASGLEREINS